MLSISQIVFSEEVDKKDLNIDKQENEKKQEQKKLSFSSSYQSSIDFNEKKKPKTINHLFELFGGYNFPRQYYGGLAVSAGYFSIGKNVQVDNNFELRDFVFSFGKVFDSFVMFNISHILRVSVAYNFFLDELSRYEGYKGMPSLSLALSSRLTKKIKFNNGFSAGYILNKYDFSPATHRSNPMSWISLNTSLDYSIIDGLFVSSGFGFKGNRRIDGVTTGSFANFILGGYKVKNFVLTLKWLNGSYDETDFNLFYIDKYRQIIVMGFTATF